MDMTVEIIKAVVQIIFISVFLYLFYNSLAGGKAAHLAKMFLSYMVVYLISFAFKLEVLVYLMEKLALPLVVFLCILYQPELRRAFAPGFTRRTRFFSVRANQTTAEMVDSIISACERLVQSKRGALIVFPRSVSIKNVIDSGTKLNADISTALIVTVFDYDTALHDGAMIIQGSKIVSAGCYLPLSAQTDIKQSFGTRHRAGLGMAEESDAAVLIVSEETGAISLAYNAKLYYNLSSDVVKSTLLAIFNNLDVQLDLKEDSYEV